MTQNLSRKLLVFVIAFTMVFSGFSFAFADPIEGDENGFTFTSISQTRLSMTEKETINVEFNLGYKPEESNLEWYFGNDKFENWENWIEINSETKECEQVFNATINSIGEDGTVKATIKTNYLFDGDDLAYWRPWWSYYGEYDLKVVDKSTSKYAVQKVSYMPYDSYHTYEELDSTINSIITNRKNADIYMSWQSIGQDTNGTDVKEVIIAKNEAAVNKWLALTERMETEPETVLAEVKNGSLTDYQIPVYITNIHANETPAVDAQINFINKIANNETIEYKTTNTNGDVVTETYNVNDILNNIIMIVRPTENPYAMENIQRANVNGFDLNRDSTYQTQIESQVATADIAKWNPTTLMELHGFLYYSDSSFSIEPCTPPHEPNLEYDLFMNYAVDGAKAFGEAASQSSEYHITADNINDLSSVYSAYWPSDDDKWEVGDSWYSINIIDGLGEDEDGNDYWVSPSDDMSSNYTPTYALFHGTIGYTVECGELNEDSTEMEMYGLIGHTAYVSANKAKLFKNQLEFFNRSVNNEESAQTEKYFVNQNNQKEVNFREKNENGKFYPEYYVIPLDVESQRDLADAYDMEGYFLRNDVKIEKLTEDVTVDGVTYKAGSIVVPLAQAKRSMANVVLYKGKKVENWTGLYSESVTNFPELRGFDCVAITEKNVFDGKTETITVAETGTSVIEGDGETTVVISNDGLDTVCAVNDLLEQGVEVGFITKAGKNYNRGDFVIKYSDLSKLKSEYVLHLIKLDSIPTAKDIEQPKVYLMGSESNDVFAFDKQMNFEIVNTAEAANVVFTSSVPEDAEGEDASAKTKIENSGLPFVGASTYVLDYAKKILDGFDFDAVLLEEATAEGSEWTYNDYEALFKVKYGKSLITASYVADGDDTIYTKGGSFITSVPKGAEVLMTAQTGDDFYKAGWWNGVEVLKGQVVAIDYSQDNKDVTIFANSITNRGHQTDDYRLAANAVYSKLLGDNFMGVADSSSSHSGGSGGGSAVTVKEVTTDTTTSVTTSKTEVKVADQTTADGTTEKVATVTVSAANQKEILSQAKANKSKDIVLNVPSDSAKDAKRVEVNLDKSFVDSIVKDTDATVTVKSPLGDKTYTQDELKALASATTGTTVTLTAEKSDTAIDTEDGAASTEEIAQAQSAAKDTKAAARSVKTKKGNVKVTYKPNSSAKTFIQSMEDKGYTVKYRFYRSTKKSSGYKAMLTKSTKTYTNTSGKADTRYYYKAQIRVYDKSGKLIAKTALNQCKYATRIFG